MPRDRIFDWWHNSSSRSVAARMLAVTRLRVESRTFRLQIRTGRSSSSKIKADLNTWYIDDGCIGGDPQTVLTNATMIRDLSSIGLEINNSKCELLLINHTDINKPQTSKLFQDQFPSLSTRPYSLAVTKVSLHQESAPLHLKAKIKVLNRITENLELTEPHQAFLKKKLPLNPQLTYLLRSAPCFKCKEELEAFDTAIRINTEKITNVKCDFWKRQLVTSIFAKSTWKPWPPFSRRPVSTMFPTCQGLVNRLLPFLTLPHWEVIKATDAWSALHYSSPWQKETQSAWDDLACRDSLAALLDTPSPWNHCRLLTAQESHTATWSEAFPIASVRNLLSPDELRIAIALRTGANIFESTEWRCGKFVDRLGLHGLSCIKNAGSFPRHSAINSILKRLLTPWYRGRSLVWDATVMDTFAESHYIVSAIMIIPGSVATDAVTDKCQKYNDLLDKYYFQPVAIETTGVYGKSIAPFLSCLAKKLVDISGDPREQQWLH